MTHSGQRYTANMIIVAARDLQDAAGTPEKPIEVSAEVKYTLREAIQLLSEEIRMLRERGFSDERIAELFTRFEIEATAVDIESYYERYDAVD